MYIYTGEYMKIGILTPSIYMYQKRYSGRIFAPGMLARHLVSGLTRRGHDVTWFTAPGETSGHIVPGDRKLLENDLQIRIFQDISARDKISLYGTKMYYEMDLLTRAYAAAKKDHLDVLHHFHSFGFLAHFFEEITGVPTLYTLHDPMPTDDMLERWLFDRFPTHRYVSISNSQRGQMGKYFYDTVYNGIDISLFPFDALGGERLIAAGRMVPDKGHDVTIAVAKRVGLPLAIASWVPATIQKSTYYKEKIEPLIDGKDIQIYSMMEGNELARFYQKARAFVFPIQWEEPFGMVMIEAMACGTPVVAYNRGSVAEIVKDGVTGFIVDEKRGVEGLVEAVRRIGEIDRAACRRHVEEHFTVEKMVEGYERAYKKILASKGLTF